MSRIKLNVKGLGHVPSFKNKKMLTRGRLITNPENQKWMSACEAAFVSQLLSEYQTKETGMPMVRSLRSWIACVMPLNDSVRSVRKVTIEVEDVAPGEEGATIEIEQL